MASSKPTLTVVLSPTAENELWGIWGYNFKFYEDVSHADAYLDYLKAGINSLATKYDEGKEVDDYPELRSVTLRKSRQGHGHIVVFELDLELGIVHIHHVIHTAQDMRGILKAQFG